TITSGCIRLPEERSADLRYVGTTSDAVGQANPLATGLAYFAISTQGPWQTQASKQEFDIVIDSTGDGVPDAVLFNTRLAGQDIFVSVLLDLRTFDVLDIEAVNNLLGDVDTAEFNSDTLVLPVALGALPGVRAGHSRIRYGVASFSAFSLDPIDLVGMDANAHLIHPLSFDVLRPGITVTNGHSPAVLYRDMPNGALVMRRDTPAYLADHGLGVLMVHYHNRVGSKAQVVHLRAVPTVSLRLSTTRVAFGHRVDARVSVANTNNAVPAGGVQIRRTGPVILRSGLLDRNGNFFSMLPNLPRGRWSLYAFYGGDVNYTSGSSGAV